MKSAIIVLILALGIVCLEIAEAAPSKTVISQNISASVSSSSSCEFYSDANVLYGTSLPFSNINPESQYNYPDGRSENDGKSDVGLVIISNTSEVWYFKIRGTDVSGNLIGGGKIAVYVGQPVNRNTGTAADGTLGQPKDWFTISSKDHTIYTSGITDKSNAPFGTLITLSFKVDGSGLQPGPHVASITYTMTTTP